MNDEMNTDSVLNNNAAEDNFCFDDTDNIYEMGPSSNFNCLNILGSSNNANDLEIPAAFRHSISCVDNTSGEGKCVFMDADKEREIRRMALDSAAELSLANKSKSNKEGGDCMMDYNPSVLDTCDDAVHSKSSCIMQGYYEDDILMKKIVRHRTVQRKDPIINRGTWFRVDYIETCVKGFLRQYPTGCIVNIGAGLDTLFFRLKSQDKLPESCLFIELELDENVSRKVRLLELEPLTPNDQLGNRTFVEPGESRYMLHAVDLMGFETWWSEKYLPFLAPKSERPVMFISECCLSYLDSDTTVNLLRLIGTLYTQDYEQQILQYREQAKLASECKSNDFGERYVKLFTDFVSSPNRSDKDIDNAAADEVEVAEKFQEKCNENDDTPKRSEATHCPVVLAMFEMVNPHDEFGSMMIQNIEERGITMNTFSEIGFVTNYKHLLHAFCGFQRIQARDALTVYNRWDAERKGLAESREWLDEFEQWEQIMSHYATIVASNNAGKSELEAVFPKIIRPLKG